MGIINQYPYTDFHELNLDFVLNVSEETKNLNEQIQDTVTEYTEKVDTLEEDFSNLQGDFGDLSNQVNNYFNNLDVQNEIDNKIDDMVSTGEFGEIVENTGEITTATENWLADHVSPGYAVDNTLTISGAAADALVTGTRINTNTTRINTVYNDEYAFLTKKEVHPVITRGYYVKGSDGTLVSNSKFAYSAMQTGYGKVIAVACEDTAFKFYVSFYDATGAFDGTGYIGNTASDQTIVHIPPYAEKFAISIQKVNNTDITLADSVAFIESLYFYCPADVSLDISDTPAESATVGGIVKSRSIKRTINLEITAGSIINSSGSTSSSAINARSNLFDRENISIIHINQAVYEYYAAWYDDTGALDGTGFIGLSDWCWSDICVPAEAKKIALTIRRRDHAAITSSDYAAIRAGVEFYLSTDKWLCFKDMAADAWSVGNAVSDLINSTSGEIVNVQVHLTPAAYINSSGVDAFNATYNVTDPVRVDGYSAIRYNRIKHTNATPLAHMAFYDINGDYISGEQAKGSQATKGYVAQFLPVPYGAVYARFTTWADTSTYGYFGMIGIPKNANELRGVDAFTADDNVYDASTESTVISMYETLRSMYPDLITRQQMQDSGTTLYEYTITTGNYNKYTSSQAKRDENPAIAKPVVLLTAGMHGNEHGAVMALYTLVKRMCEQDYRLMDILNYVTLKIIPIVSPSAFDNNTRLNANGVNINRNFNYNWQPAAPGDNPDNYPGAAAADQPETRIVQAWLDANTSAVMYIDCHNSSWVTEISCLLGDNTTTSTDIKKKYLMGMNKIIPYWKRVRNITSTQTYAYTGGYNPGSPVAHGTGTGYARGQDAITSFTHEASWDINSTNDTGFSEITIGTNTEAIACVLNSLKSYFEI